MNNSGGLIFSAGLCLVSNLIHIMAKLPGNRVHDATVAQRNLSHIKGKAHIVGLAVDLVGISLSA